MSDFILQGKTETRTGTVRKVYYGGINGAKGRAFFSTKHDAPRFSKEVAEKVAGHLEKIDNKQWVPVEAEE